MANTPNSIPPKHLRTVMRITKKRAPSTRKRHRGPGPKQKRLGQAIRKARLAASLTQAELGQKLGLQGHTVHRWETNQSAPTPRHESEMVMKVHNVDAATALQVVFDAARSKAAPEVAAQVTKQPAPPPIQASGTFELAVFGLADDLDLPPRRVRRPLLRLVERLRVAHIPLDVAQQQLESWIAEQQY